MIKIFVAAFLGTLASVFRDAPYGADSYYFFRILGIPEDVLWFTPVVLFVTLFTVLWLVKQIAEVLEYSDSELIAVLVVAAPFFVTQMNLFEDDLLGLVLSLSATYFYALSLKDGFTYKKVHGFLFFSWIATVVWEGSLYFIGLFVLHTLAQYGKAVWIAILGLIRYAPRPNMDVAEMTPGAIWIVLGLGPAFFGIRTLVDKTLRAKQHPFIITWSLYSIALALLLTKLIYLAAIPLAFLTKQWLDTHPHKDNLVLTFVIFGLIFGGYGVFLGQPTSGMTEAVKEISNITQGEPINNTWGYGHWLSYYGATPLYDNLRPSEKLPGVPAWEWSNTTSSDPLFCFQHSCLSRVRS